MRRLDLPIKKHPSYSWQFTKIMLWWAVVFTGMWIAGKITDNYEYKTLTNLLVICGFASFAVMLFFMNRLSKRAKCPQCNKKMTRRDNKRIKLSGSLENGNSYMTCTSCKVIWDLGIGQTD